MTPFMVRKKHGRQRLVLDCRLVNEAFRKPPKMDIGAAENLAGLRVPEGEKLHVAQADIENCFWQCGLEPELSVFFGMPKISGVDACSLGIEQDMWGNDVRHLSEVYPCVTSLPMGWTWAFYLAQELHRDILLRSGFGPERIIVGGWPIPDLAEHKVVSLPYCDNLTVIGTDPERVLAERDRALSMFEKMGFFMHGISDVESDTLVLGSAVGGEQ